MLHESNFKLALAGRKDGETMKLQHFPSEHRNHAAVDIDYLPINKIRSSRTQEHRGADQFFRFAPASSRGPTFDPGIKLRVIGEHLSHLGDKIAWSDGVDLDVVLGPVCAHCFGKDFQTSLCGGVRTGCYPA